MTSKRTVFGLGIVVVFALFVAQKDAHADAFSDTITSLDNTNASAWGAFGTVNMAAMMADPQVPAANALLASAEDHLNSAAVPYFQACMANLARLMAIVMNDPAEEATQTTIFTVKVALSASHYALAILDIADAGALLGL